MIKTTMAATLLWFLFVGTSLGQWTDHAMVYREILDTKAIILEPHPINGGSESAFYEEIRGAEAWNESKLYNEAGVHYGWLTDTTFGNGKFSDGKTFPRPSRPIHAYNLGTGKLESKLEWRLFYKLQFLEDEVQGDGNNDGALDNLEIQPFLQSLLFPPPSEPEPPILDPDVVREWSTGDFRQGGGGFTHPLGPVPIYDFNQDGRFDNVDVSGFLDALIGGY